MTKPKGTRDKATLQKMENAAAHLEERREEKTQLYRKMDIATALIMASELRSREIKKQLHNLEKEIAELEKLKLEWDAREQKAADMQRIQDLVNSLVDQGISAEEIIRELEKNPFSSTLPIIKNRNYRDYSLCRARQLCACKAKEKPV